MNYFTKMANRPKTAMVKHLLKTVLFSAFLVLGFNGYSQNWQLVWADEFTNGIGPDWVFETGNGSGGWGNNELQYYRSQNATVSNGQLVITARQESFGGFNYTSARMKTQGRKSWKYGRIEARIQLPAFQGSWPAFWMLGDNITSVGWPACGEIDIMEQVNTNNTAHGTIHWDNNGYVSYGGSTGTNVTGWHVYAIEWNASSIKWFLDGVQYHEANIQNGINGTGEFHNNFFIILNMAVGGNWPGFTVNNSALPASMRVDYVRVYQAGSGGGAPVGQTIWLRGSNNQYVSSENGQSAMMCNRTSVQAWEQFTVVSAGGGKIALRGNNGQYVSSENGQAAMMCNRTSIQGWEAFDWLPQPDGTIALRGNNGQYVSSENGTQGMRCNRTSVGGWEKFTWGTGSGARTMETAEESVVLSAGETTLENNLLVYPNPVKDKKLHIDFSRTKDIEATVVITSMEGKKILDAVLTRESNEVQIPSHVPNGLYILSVNYDGKKLTKKVLIE